MSETVRNTKFGESILNMCDNLLLGDKENHAERIRHTHPATSCLGSSLSVQKPRRGFLSQRRERFGVIRGISDGTEILGDPSLCDMSTRHCQAKYFKIRWNIELVEQEAPSLFMPASRAR